MPNACDSIPEKKPSLLLQWTPLPPPPQHTHTTNNKNNPNQLKKTKNKNIKNK